ncbi:tyrosine-type recombinase/integrase [Dactylosporangium sp. NPDC000555]|uniref:tyrosine-type recombinase/integrase n=1 Tax=Dactylosporangium sp. NPDC000555 TaxID=3154260 RepID=UPI003330ABDF
MPADRTRLDAAWTALAELGITLDDLQQDARPPQPTVEAYLPKVVAAAGPGSRRAYRTYWTRMAMTWRNRPIDTITATEVQAMQVQAAEHATARRNHRDGRYAGEIFLAAARAFYNRTIADNLINATDSPAHQIGKPRRLPSTRRALTYTELADINQVARTTGNDPILDALLLRLHTETACRRGGALNLRRMDLDTDRGLVLLREKGGTTRWQPISLDLATRLAEHARIRGAVLPTDTLLRYRNGRPLTGRRYDHLWHRIGHHLAWVAVHGVTVH